MNLLEVRKVARETMDEYGLSDWTFEFDNAKQRFGVCRISTRTISLSRELTELNSSMQVIDTILHEIAHALTPDQGHNHKWRAMAKSIGCSATRTYPKTLAQPKAKYTASCANCGMTEQLHRKPRYRQACLKCCAKFNGGRFSEKYLVEYKEN